LKYVDFVKWLPTSVLGEYYKGNALKSLFEIGATIGIAIASLTMFCNQKALRCVLIFLGVNTALMGIYAIIQDELDFPIIYNYFYTTASFYGSFPLSNAAGAFLNIGCAINFSLAVGMLKKRKFFFSVLWFSFALICSVSSYMSQSEGARLFCIFFWLIVLPLSFYKVVSKFYSKTTATISILMAAFLVGLVAYLFINSNAETLVKKYENVAKNLNESASSRFFMYKLSSDIISKNPIFGSGGKSCQYLLTEEMIKSRDSNKGSLASSTYHAHSDPLEYLMEFGIVGAFFICLSMAFWIWNFYKSSPDFESWILFIGALICLLHSCFDMHLHILSTMIVFAVVASACLFTAPKQGTLK